MANAQSKIRTIIAEALVVAIGGFVFALVANQVSPRGLTLTRDYFPGRTNAPAIHAELAPVAATNLASTNAPNTNDSSTDEVSQRLRDKGLQEVAGTNVQSLLRGPGYKAGQIILIDARDEEHYADGHIPGAWQLDPYHPEKQLGPTLTLCQAADTVVVYCTGGECEDADTTAIMLRDAGIPAQKIFVYGGGYTAWKDSHLPLETGARNSGVITNVK